MLESLIAALGSSACTCFLGLIARKRVARCVLRDNDLAEILEARKMTSELAHNGMKAYIDKHFQILGELGEGASGVVHKVQHAHTGKFYAMKCIEKNDVNGVNDAESLDTEISCLRKLRHRHIVNLFEVIESDKMLWIIMEWAAGGGLYDRIVKLDHFSERSAARILKQILKAVHYMHSMGVVHRDLKPENVLLDSEKEDADVKVADFGLSAQLALEGYHPEESMRLKKSKCIEGGFCGSPISMAPEVSCDAARYSPQCDMWSVGCMAYELLCGNPPFLATSAGELFELVKASPGPSFAEEVWRAISPEGKDLVAQLLKKAPEDRLSAKEALNHTWFAEAPDHHNEAVHSCLKKNAEDEYDEDDDVPSMRLHPLRSAAAASS